MNLDFKKQYRNFNEANIKEDCNLGKELRVFETFETLISQFYNKKFLTSDFFLELGCGNGNFLSVLEKKNFCYKGLDIDDLNFEKDKIPVDDGSVDYVICNSVIEHIKNDFFFISEIKRVLKNGGILILITPNFSYCYKNFYDDPTHVNPFTPKKVENLMSIVGMRNVTVLPWIVKKSVFFWKIPFKFFIARYCLISRGDSKLYIPSFFKGKSLSILASCQK